MEIKIDGQTIVLTDAQAQQLKTAILNEVPTAVKPVAHSSFKMYCRPPQNNGKLHSIPVVITYPATSLLNLKNYQLEDKMVTYPIVGRDFSQDELQCFVKALKTFGKSVWPNFKV